MTTMNGYGFALALAFCTSVNAQSANELAIGMDPGSDDGFAPSYYVDLQLRGEYTKRIPGRLDDIDRVRARLRTGALLLVSDWELGVGLEASTGNDSSGDNRRNKDNERSNDINLDQLYARRALNERFEFQVGKSQLPMQLTPLVWDQDLRPIGLGVTGTGEIVGSASHSWHLRSGYFAPDFIFDNEKPRLAALQMAGHFFEDRTTQGQAVVSYLHFSQLERLPLNGTARTNRSGSGNYLSDYELLDVQLNGQTKIWENPVRLTLNGVQNLGADDLDRAGRISLVFGKLSQSAELGFAYHRAQRDSVLAVAADDEWWFQSFAHGTMAWIEYPWSEDVSLRFAAFDETRDGLQNSTKRLLFDLNASW